MIVGEFEYLKGQEHKRREVQWKKSEQLSNDKVEKEAKSYKCHKKDCIEKKRNGKRRNSHFQRESANVATVFDRYEPIGALVTSNVRYT